jgi:hypothetical protein
MAPRIEPGSPPRGTRAVNVTCGTFTSLPLLLIVSLSVTVVIYNDSHLRLALDTSCNYVSFEPHHTFRETLVWRSSRAQHRSTRTIQNTEPERRGLQAFTMN